MSATIPVWVALISIIPGTLGAYGGLLAARRTGGSDKKFNRVARDVEFIKSVLTLHVTDSRLHPELVDLGTRPERGKRNG